MKWFGGKLHESTVKVVDSKDKDLSGMNVLILSYEQAVVRVKTLKEMEINCFIVDEVHYIKSQTSQRSQTLIPLLMHAKRIMLLSGTPILNRSVEVFNFLKILRPDICPEFHQFKRRY
jgi:SWI/SNF-related matrix-associated actin-dependent regulator 1 of chromatin subfamily A